MTIVFDPIQNRFIDDELEEDSGAKILYGLGAPGNELGESGDFYIDTLEYKIYQKGDVWGDGVKIIGSDGRSGEIGPVGPIGPKGNDGRDGADGRDGVNGVDGLDGINGRNGIDGKSVELRNNRGAIEWRREGEDWVSLYVVPISSVSGGGGGRKIGELRDTRTAGATIRQILRFDGTHWVNDDEQSLAGYVPYIGAEDDVDLGTHSLTAQGLITTTEFIQTSTAANASISIGGANPFAATALNSISIANYTDYGVTPFVGHNNIIVGHDVAFNGYSFSGWAIYGNNAANAIFQDTTGGVLVGHTSDMFGDVGRLVGVGNLSFTGLESVTVGDSAKSATRSVSVGYNSGASLTGAETGNVFLGPYAGSLVSSQNNKLYVSNQLFDLITGDFFTPSLSLNGATTIGGTLQLGGNLLGDGYDIQDIINFTFGDDYGYLRTHTHANDSFALQAYDVDGAAYISFISLVAGNTPSCTISGNSIWNGNIVELSYGGTNANLTADNGGIVWSNATQLQILSGTATANKMLLSGATAAPSWSTSTIPSSAGAAGKILRSDGTNYALSTSTFADTYSAKAILYASSANTIAGSSNFGYDGTNVTIGSSTYTSMFNVGSSAQFQVDSSGRVGVGGAPAADSDLYLARTRSATTGNLWGAQIGGSFNASSGTVSSAGGAYIYANYNSNVATISNAYGLLISGATSPGGTITTGTGLKIAAVGYGTTRYGLYVDTPTGGTNNYGAFIGGVSGLNRTPQSGVQLGITASNQYGIYMDGTLATANSSHYALSLQTNSTPTSNSYNSYSVVLGPTFTSGASGINSTAGIVISPTFAGSGTIAQYVGVYVDIGSLSGTTLTTAYGIKVNSLSVGTTRYGIHVSAPTGGTSNYGSYINGPSSFNVAPSVDTSLAVGGLGSASLHSLYVGGTISKTGTNLYMQRITGTITPQSSSYNGYALFLDPTFSCGASGLNAVMGMTIYATISGSGTTNIFRALNIDTSGVSGVTVTTGVGIYVGALAVGDTRYGIYVNAQSGGSTNICAYFGGAIKLQDNSTGAGTPLLGTNCPASTLTAPYTWLKFISSDGSTVYVPAWK